MRLIASATSGCDLNISAQNIVIPANMARCTISINALTDNDIDPYVVERREQITLSIASAATYAIGAPDTVNITLIPVDDATPAR